MLTDDQIEAKYKIVFVKKQRYYHEDLSKVDHTLETSTPFSLETGTKSFLDTSWKQLLIDVCTDYLRVEPFKKDDLLKYIMKWNNKTPFSSVPGKNLYEIGNGIYLMCNQTAVHACWLLRDILTIFGVDLSKCTFIIHRPPFSEPPECRRFYEEKTKTTFRYYYCQLLKNSDEKADKVIKNIERLNKILPRVSKSYDNFFLFDSYYTFSSYKPKLLNHLRFNLNLDTKTIQLSDMYLSILGEFYKTIY